MPWSVLRGVDPSARGASRPPSATDLEFDPNELSPVRLSVASIRQLLAVFSEVICASKGGEAAGDQSDVSAVAITAQIPATDDSAYPSADPSHGGPTALSSGGDRAGLPGACFEFKVAPVHLERRAVVCIRQSSPEQVRQNQESQLNQNWFYRRIYSGESREPDVIRKPPYGNYLIRDDPELIERLHMMAWFIPFLSA
jgi:hypothetical protein